MKQTWMRMGCLILILGMLGGLGLAGLAEDAETDAPCVLIRIKDYGDIYAELYPQYAPITVENFLSLVNRNFYDGLTFHRIITNFMIQGGDPLGTGMGGGEQKIKGEFSQNGVDNPLKHERGVLSMARSAQMDSASSQFFIMHATSPHLDGAYAAFGKVLAGMRVVDRICLSTPVQDSNGTVLASDQPVIESIRTVDRAEALAAAEKEAENGRGGTVYHDAVSSLSFPVPQGWNRVTEDQRGTIFQAEAAPEKQLLLATMDVWARYQAQLTQRGYTQEAIDTEAVVQLGLVRLGSMEFAQETHGGRLTYTTQATANNVTQTAYVGADHGVIFELVFFGDRTDPLFAQVEEILDHLSFE